MTKRVAGCWGCIIAVLVLAIAAQVAVAAPPVAASAGADTGLVRADATGRAPQTLTLPFKASNTATTPGIGPLSSNVLLSDGFEAPFTWEIGYFGDAYLTTTWGRTSYRSQAGSYSAYCAMVNNPYVGYYYPDGMDGYMVRGPFDFSKATASGLDYDQWLDTEKSYDWLYVYYSLDGVNFRLIDGWSGYSAGWVHEHYSLDAQVVGLPQVWILFDFDSDLDNGYEGAYVDNVLLSSVTPDPTPTPTPTPTVTPPPPTPTPTPTPTATPTPTKPALGRPICPISVRHGQRFAVYGSLKPHFPAGAWTVKVKAFRYVSGVWKLQRSYMAVNADWNSYTKYKARISLTRPGKYRFKASTAATAEWLAARTSFSRTLTVK